MKRTDLERHQRELRRAEKKDKVLQRKMENISTTALIGQYIDSLFSLFMYDTEDIFNINSEIKVLELLEKMKTDLPEKQWDNVIRKSVKKTRIRNKEKAVNAMKQLIGIN